MDRSGKVAVVTGGASGIGRGLVERFLHEGMRVVIADFDESRLPVVAAELAERYGDDRVLAVRTDVSSSAEVDALAASTWERFGEVDILCNNAGVAGVREPIWELTTADWQASIGVNLWGVINGIKTFVPRMVERNDGYVVNTSSIAGLGVLPRNGSYAAAKHAVVSMSETLAADLVLAGITGVGVSVLCPVFINTDIHRSASNHAADGGAAERARLEALSRAGQDPAEVADLVVRSIDEHRFYVVTDPGVLWWAKIRSDTLLDGRPDPPLYREPGGPLGYCGVMDPTAGPARTAPTAP